MSFAPAGPETLQQMIDRERSAEGADRRAALFWNTQIDVESMTLSGRLVAAAEHGEPVRITLANGMTRHGLLCSVGADAIDLASLDGTHAIIATDQIATVRSENRKLVRADENAVGPSLRELLIGLAERRATIRIVLRSAGEEAGELVACGADVCVVRGNRRDLVYVAVAAITEVQVLA